MHRSTQDRPYNANFVDWFGHEIRIVTYHGGRGKLGLRMRWYYSGDMSLAEIYQKDEELCKEMIIETGAYPRSRRLKKTG